MNVEFAVKKTFVGGKFEDVLKCITSTDMIFWVTLLYARKVSMSNVNVRNAKSKMFETRTAKAAPRPPT